MLYGGHFTFDQVKDEATVKTLKERSHRLQSRIGTIEISQIASMRPSSRCKSLGLLTLSPSLDVQMLLFCGSAAGQAKAGFFRSRFLCGVSRTSPCCSPSIGSWTPGMGEGESLIPDNS